MLALIPDDSTASSIKSAVYSFWRPTNPKLFFLEVAAFFGEREESRRKRSCTTDSLTYLIYLTYLPLYGWSAQIRQPMPKSGITGSKATSCRPCMKLYTCRADHGLDRLLKHGGGESIRQEHAVTMRLTRFERHDGLNSCFEGEKRK